jgi:hypothetical protein
MLRVFENKIPRRIFGPKGEGITEGWRNMYHVTFTIFTLLKILLTNKLRQKRTIFITTSVIISNPTNQGQLKWPDI